MHDLAILVFFLFNDTATTEIYTLSLHDALPIWNLLVVNNGDRTFTEAAERYAVADTGFSTHAVFLDYDGDACIDLFLLNNSPRDFSRAEAIRNPVGIRGETRGSYNQLYRNTCRGTFANVSDQAGILRVVGYGLGVVVSDL